MLGAVTPVAMRLGSRHFPLRCLVVPFPPLTQVVLCPAPTQDLNFGQLVQIFEEYGGEDGWYRGRLFGDTQGASEPLGIFPKKYVAIKVLCPTPPTPRACVSARASARPPVLLSPLERP